MEFAAWFLHKYVMHGFLWSLHDDHHNTVDKRPWQYNDFFALVFAIPSFLLILSDHLYSKPIWGAVGFGIMLYGFAYFFVHEVVIHRRFKSMLFFSKYFSHWYFEALNEAHKVHHAKKTKFGTQNFGMLLVDFKYFKNSFKRASARRAKSSKI